MPSSLRAKILGYLLHYNFTKILSQCCDDLTMDCDGPKATPASSNILGSKTGLNGSGQD